MAGWLGFEPVPTPRMINLMDAWGWYDNLEDLAVDLPSGLVLISSEDLEKHNLKFNNGEILPYDALDNYYNRKRWGVIKDLAASSRAVFEIGLPAYIALPAYLYFQTRWWNLVKPLYKVEGARFEIPKDAVAASISEVET